MSTEFRALRADERDAVLDLWGEVFNDDGHSYFEHYFAGDPAYQDADCLVALVNGKMASAVHICRRQMEWEGKEILCGAIANVATCEAYRRRGLSRTLLRQAIARMEAEQFGFSILFTGSYSHYGALGWEQVQTPWFRVQLMKSAPLTAGPVRRLPPAPLPDEVPALYETAPRRPLHMRRPRSYFAEWTGWFWREAPGTTVLLAGPEGDATGYAVVAARESREAHRIHELRALDLQSERDLLREAARWACEQGSERLLLSFLPQFGGTEVAAELGALTTEHKPHMMLRGITLPAEEIARIGAAYASGEAQFWQGDDF
jgi:predicted acetyltransferase